MEGSKVNWEWKRERKWMPEQRQYSRKTPQKKQLEMKKLKKGRSIRE
jgi:hypothetical protein